MTRAGSWAIGPVDTVRPHFEAVHSYYKQTVARIGLPEQDPEGNRLAVEFLPIQDRTAARIRSDVIADLEARVERFGANATSAAELCRLLRQSCAGSENLYSGIHWCLVDPKQPVP